ncbi:LOW QUALITY PROTEIN: novel immune-type receptor 9 [Ctenopharyngodon idella]|uniref:LOW QUALITY PROTEIN: novel immune-type receptor 9 n=1 Tax=Ctenopharyngodon idella TaxID=7959 RepID=UPI00223082FF|nr:LOW QUALITY PROTEIN: novel immune-type receptor 9 [Ctenopharyngodon idella]
MKLSDITPALPAKHLNNPPVFTKPGETINLPCFYQSQIAMHFSWYKHEPGQNPRLISTIYKNTQISDSATYYCGSAYSNVMEFVEGTELIVEGLKSYTVVKQHAFIPLHSGDSVNLTCTVLNQTCVGNHSVYWLIHESQESHPKIIGAHGTSTGQCDRISESGFTVRRCVYSFSKKDLNLSDAGTYYCAVAACGEILLGNGTKLDIIGADSTQMMTFVLLSFVRTVLLLITIATVIVWYCMKSKRMSKEGCSSSAIRDKRSRPEGRLGASCSKVI